MKVKLWRPVEWVWKEGLPEDEMGLGTCGGLWGWSPSRMIVGTTQVSLASGQGPIQGVWGLGMATTGGSDH